MHPKQILTSISNTRQESATHRQFVVALVGQSIQIVVIWVVPRILAAQQLQAVSFGKVARHMKKKALGAQEDLAAAVLAVLAVLIARMILKRQTWLSWAISQSWTLA